MWHPNAKFRFPVSGKRNLKFQLSWFNRWSWLAYSAKEDGAFCKICVLFSSSGAGVGHQPLGKLVKKKFSNWKDAIEEFNIHEKCGYHKTCVVRAAQFKAVTEEGRDSVHMQLNKGSKAQAEENRQKIMPIIETVILCGRQGLALRGHRDAGPISLGDEPLENDGNFRALLRFRVKGGDKNLENHLKSHNQNAMYISPHVQNEIINACNNIILKALVDKINSAQCFTVLADETTDVQGTEQLSLCVRYLDLQTNDIREDFLQFVPVTDVSGKGLASTILSSLNRIGVDLTYLRGQGYDGAAAMSGQFSGVQAHIKEKYPNAVYTHCASHCLNLVVSNACSISSIRNCLGVVTNVCNFFKFPKRLNVLKNAVATTAPESKKTRLQSLCPTRWIERHDSVLVFVELFDAVVEALETVSLWQEREASSGAHQLLCALNQADFLVALYVMNKVFSISMPLSRLLQSEGLDILAAIEAARAVELALQNLRKDAKEEFGEIFTLVQSRAAKLGVTISIPRRTGRQTQRCNISTNSAEEYFRISVYNALLDHFIAQLQERFSAHKSLLQAFMCLLPKNRSKPSKNDEEEIRLLACRYSSDLECSEESVVGELHIWYNLLSAKSEAPKSALRALRVCDKTHLPAIHTLLQIFVTLPVTTASSERSFSSLRRLKTYLRNSTGEHRLNGLALLNIHRDITIQAEDVLNEFSKTSRRLGFQV